MRSVETTPFPYDRCAANQYQEWSTPTIEMNEKGGGGGGHPITITIHLSLSPPPSHDDLITDSV